MNVRRVPVSLGIRIDSQDEEAQEVIVGRLDMLSPGNVLAYRLAELMVVRAEILHQEADDLSGLGEHGITQIGKY